MSPTPAIGFRGRFRQSQQTSNQPNVADHGNETWLLDICLRPLQTTLFSNPPLDLEGCMWKFVDLSTWAVRDFLGTAMIQPKTKHIDYRGLKVFPSSPRISRDSHNPNPDSQRLNLQKITRCRSRSLKRRIVATWRRSSRRRPYPRI